MNRLIIILSTHMQQINHCKVFFVCLFVFIVYCLEIGRRNIGSTAYAAVREDANSKGITSFNFIKPITFHIVRKMRR